MISFRSHVCAIAERSVSEIHASALYAGMRIDTSGFMMKPSPTIQHRRSGSSRPPHSTNGWRQRNLSVLAGQPSDSYKDRLQNTIQWLSLIPLDHQAGRE